MSYKIRKAITERIIELVNSERGPYLLRNLPTFLELRKTGKAPELHLPAIKARNLFGENGATLIKQIVDAKYDDRLISNVTAVIKKENSRAPPTVVFRLNPDTFFAEALTCDNWENQIRPKEVEKVVIDFSSPNIAKPFHVGHLRSTIIGNFIANLHKHLGDDVVRLNYLGDWGTQLGLLQVGLEMNQVSEAELKAKPIQTLYNAYVSANREAAKNSAVAERARQVFTELENNQYPEGKKLWEKIREYTVVELQDIYGRVGVEFDEYAWESQYSQKEIQAVLFKLAEKGLLLDEIDGKKVVEVGDRRVPVVKSDGSTLYLTRDIAAILDRACRHKFDKIFYVVDNAQTDHFKACFHVATALKPTLWNKAVHVKFGRIKGMSTRSGNAVFLTDILDEARDIMAQKQIESPTTKIDLRNFDHTTADVLGVSAVIINDLKQRRQRDYDFSWDKVLQVNGDSGIKLQYTHCRLHSLIHNVAVEPAETPNPLLLPEDVAVDLIIEIARFPEVLLRTQESLEACILVNYLFTLSNSTSRALKVLNIKGEKNAHIQSQRMLLFTTAKDVIRAGMEILGLKPLEKM